MVRSSFNAIKFFKIVNDVFIYSASSFLIFVFFTPLEFSAKLALKSFFPVLFSTYWFATTYLILYLISPFLNKFIEGLDQSSHCKLILLLISMWSVIPTFTTAKLGMSHLGWFLTLYVMASYIRIYLNSSFPKCSFNIFIGFSSYLVVLFLIVLINFIDVSRLSVMLFVSNVTKMNNFFVLICSIFLFLGFKNINVRLGVTLNAVAASSFGVYLIHDNIFVRTFLWNELFNNDTYHGFLLVLHALFSILSTYIICTFLDYLRIKLFNRPILAYVDLKVKLLDRLEYFAKRKLRKRGMSL